MEDFNKLSILLVVRNPVGGIRTYMRYVYGQEIFRGCRFAVLFAESDLTELYVDTMDKLGFESHCCKGNNLSLLLKLYKLLRAGKYDIIHSHGFTSGVLVSLLARLFSTPHIMTAHDVLLPGLFNGIFGWFKKMILPRVFSYIDVINAVSGDVENNLIEMLPLIERKKIVTILNGVATHEFLGVKPEGLRPRFNLGRDTFLIGFFGRFMSQKGFRYLIDAVRILSSEGRNTNDLRVVAVGSGGFIREDRELIRSQGLEKYFIFLPAVSDPASLLLAMNVIAIPSLWEACPLLPMEALLLGVPVIASNCIGLREVVNGTPAFQFKAGDTRKLAEVIADCLEDDRREEFQRYRYMARERFDVTQTGKELFQLYNRVCDF